MYGAKSFTVADQPTGSLGLLNHILDSMTFEQLERLDVASHLIQLANLATG